jgi:adenine-specific DNA-methyltransferase
MEKLNKEQLSSLNIREEQVKKLKGLFPEVFTEDHKLDWDRLRLTLGEHVDVGKERFGMNWPGKADCFKTIQQPSIATLVPSREESIDFDKTQNLFIEGDNLEVLKLLQKSYLGKVKMIYIDPPYNTGNEFIYPDNYSENLQTYLEYTGQVDREGRKFSTNAESDGRFHSKWMNMMYPRLFLAKNLMAEDGVIFISIDDHEVNNLRLLCNEIFGEENFITNLIWQRVYSPKNSARFFSEDHDYILVYVKNSEVWSPTLLPRTEEANARYENTDEDPRGPWKPSDLTARNYYGEGQYEITGPTGKIFKPGKGRYWRQSLDNFNRLVAENRVWWGPNKDSMPSQKRFLSEVKQGIVPQTLLLYSEVGHTQEAKKELLDFVDFDDTENILNSVKPTRLLRHLIKIGTEGNNSDIVLDFFAGSGPTAHAIMAQNIDDGGNRRFILVQLPEPLPVEEQKVKTIADLAKSRLRTFSYRQKQSLSNTLNFNAKHIDLGFKLLGLKSSNFNLWKSNVEKTPEAIAKQLEMNIGHISTEATQEAILFELLLKSGFELTTPIQKEIISEKPVYSVAEGELLVCLEKQLTQELIKGIAEMKPSRVICLDEGFQNNDQLKTNAVQIMKSRKVVKFQTV